MFTDDGSIQIECDSPPYYIVESCQQLGLKRPEDVRWCRLSQAREKNKGETAVDGSIWKRLFGGGRHPCTCGTQLPPLDHYTFTLAPKNRKVSYLLGQCPRCLSIFWESADQ